MLAEMSATEFLHTIIRQSSPEQWFGETMARYRIGENLFYVKFGPDYCITEISFNEGTTTVVVK